MTKDELLNWLFAYNEDELFYREYYDAKKQRWKLAEFLSRQDSGEVLKRRLFIPEIAGPLIPEEMADQDYFETDSNISVYLGKHNRYTPAFNHRHIFYEMVYVLSGSCTQEFQNDTLNLKEGDICLLAPNASHSTGVFNDSVVINTLIRRSTFDDIFYNLLREPNLISTFFNQTLYRGKYHDYLIFRCGQDEDIRNAVLDMFLEQLNKEPYYESILNSMLMLLFSKILRRYEKTAVLPATHKKYGSETMELLSYIEDHYQDLTLGGLAEHFHLSISYCSRHIRELTGSSYSAILRKIRLQRAQALLSGTNLSIADVSRSVGFENPEHFCRVFKQAFGMTPGKYRECSN